LLKEVCKGIRVLRNKVVYLERLEADVKVQERLLDQVSVLQLGKGLLVVGKRREGVFRDVGN